MQQPAYWVETKYQQNKTENRIKLGEKVVKFPNPNDKSRYNQQNSDNSKDTIDLPKKDMLLILYADNLANIGQNLKQKF